MTECNIQIIMIFYSFFKKINYTIEKRSLITRPTNQESYHNICINMFSYCAAIIRFKKIWELFVDAPTELQESRLQEFGFVLLSYRLRPGGRLHG